ncbi:MAG: sulfotransferase [Myxococcota bacterium]
MASDRPTPFDETALLADACRRTGLTNFGNDGFRAPLRVLLASLAEAPLNAVGKTVMRSSVRRSLMQRLLAEDWLARHPEIANERIEAPLVVVGMMRSGTTLIQRLLARDPRFYCAFGWEIAEPAPRPETNWNAIDPRIADGEARSLQMRNFAPQLYAIHPTDAHEADEEIVFLADAFFSHVPEASCDVPAYRSWLDAQDFTPAYRYLLRMLQLLQWQKRKRGEQRTRWVLKTPAHLGYLDTLLSVFPDAHVIHIHRSPLAAIPSGANLNLTLWRMYADDVDPKRVGHQWLERMAWATCRGLAARDRMPDASLRFSDVWYRDAVRDPLA